MYIYSHKVDKRDEKKLRKNKICKIDQVHERRREEEKTTRK